MLLPRTLTVVPGYLRFPCQATAYRQKNTRCTPFFLPVFPDVPVHVQAEGGKERVGGWHLSLHRTTHACQEKGSPTSCLHHAQQAYHKGGRNIWVQVDGRVQQLLLVDHLPLLMGHGKAGGAVYPGKP